MANQCSFRAKIADQVISQSEVFNINRQDDKLQFISLQSLQLRNILFTQSEQEGDDDDDPIVPPN